MNVSVAILVEFKARERSSLYLPMATEGTYSREWVPTARKLGLFWLPLFQTGCRVEAADLPAVMEELRQLRVALSNISGGAPVVERIDSILESLNEVELTEVDHLFIG